ncbi:hypothetical protein X975_15061, partial [Stegodyphus mimosarum]
AGAIISWNATCNWGNLGTPVTRFVLKFLTLAS